jgi:hypothetical protein
MSAYVRYFDIAQIQIEWLNNNLSAEELLDYNAALDKNSQIWGSYESQGLITLEPIYETVYIPEINENIDVKIGEKLVLSPGVSPSQLQMHPDYAEWLNRLPDYIFNKIIILQN